MQHKPAMIAATLCLAFTPALRAAPSPAKPATPAKTAAKAPARNLLVPRDGMVLTKSATLKPGVYALPRGIVLGADNVTLDGNGATLIGSGKGQAVLSKRHAGVTVKNLKVSKYFWGIRLEDAKNPTVRDCRIRETDEVTPADGVWLDIWKKSEDAYGAAIILIGATGGAVSGNDVQHQQNGISLYNCTGVTVEKNNASFQSGWGLHLFASSKNVIQDNLADWCDRIHKRGERYYYPGADAAGMLVIWGSSNNIIRRNMFRGGGDGVFVAGYHPEYGKLGCNDNLFEDNDGSYSPNNAFESTFCKGNIFRNNRANASNYGFWLGYSWENQIEGNEIRSNRIAGIAIEHGHHNEIATNRIARNERGIALWARADASFTDQWPDSVTSAFYDIRENTFTANGIGLLSKVDTGRAEDGSLSAADLQKFRPHDYQLRGNVFYGNQIGALLMDTDKAVFEGNRFQANTGAGLRLEGSKEASATRNAFADEETHAWSDTPVAWTVPSPKDGTPEGNYWSGAESHAIYTPAGPNPGTDTAPMKSPATPLEKPERAATEMEMLRSTPR